MNQERSSRQMGPCSGAINLIGRADAFLSGRISKIDRVAMLVRDSDCQVTKPEILRQLPDVSQKTCERALRVLLDSGQIIKLSGGRYTSYIWNKDS